MGRRNTPTALKILRGNPGKRPLNRDEPQPDALDAGIPDVLTDAAARAEWTRAITPATKIGHVTSADRALAIAHCQLWATWLAQIAAAAGQPFVMAAGKNGYMIPNQAHVQAQRTIQLLISVDERLGFSPTSRAKVVAKGPGSTRVAIDKQRAKFFNASRG
jgi:phage terminase small subunit